MKKSVVLFSVLLLSIQCYANLTISFKHLFNNEKVVLNSKTYSTAINEDISFDRLKYYIGNITLVYASGKIVKDKNNYHLIDIEQPESALLDLGAVPDGKIIKIEFGIGVDSLSNSEGLIEGDLDPMNGMYWAWSSGFINFKLEGSFSQDKTSKFKYHIGGFLPPNQSYQTTSLPVNAVIKNGEPKALQVDVNLATLFNKQKIGKEAVILSPSKKSHNYSQKLPQLFSCSK